jgi:hypothetical protein
VETFKNEEELLPAEKENKSNELNRVAVFC